VNRFGELHRSLNGISEKVLSQELRELERHGIIARKAYAEVPLKVEYSVTPLGRRLASIVDSMHEWGTAYLQEENDKLS
jgi:DNA-binding HxlR family transcriptional regulator